MRVLFVAVEMSPIAKVGGLADVVGALPKTLRKLGQDVRVVLPLYMMIERASAVGLTHLAGPFLVEMNAGSIRHADLYQAEIEGVPVYFIAGDEAFERAISSDSLYQPGGEQHLFFSCALLAGMQKIGWIPDVVHCHDWHTGFVPALMRERWAAAYSETSTLFTIHNFAYQGEFGIEVLDKVGLPRALFNHQQVEAWGRVNFLKTGCVLSDLVNTVSPTYAKEIQTPEYGCTLEGLMRHLAEHGLLTGILNGIDTEVFDPQTDRFIPAHFSARDPSGKAECKRMLRKELKLPDTDAPLMGVVSRLSSQKGLDLIVQAAESIAALPAQLVVQGLGEPPIGAALRQLEKQLPKNVRFVEQFDPPIAQRIYAGSDMFLMPSRFEPCGLGQMIAMRYGTIPIVRSTGGLKDSVIDGYNGFAFSGANSSELIEALQRAAAAFSDVKVWPLLVRQAMTSDFTWDRSAEQYIELYKKCRAGRMATVA